jgi:cellulose synthase/poly-beta-1,6-N-acetylglucosamine synthase-like glycosyltransferase/exo-beta-1,3-glucanase (GH17 family)
MRIIVALLLVCLGSAALWAALDRPLDAPDWHGQFKGVAYTPSHLYSEQQKDEQITEAMLRQDLEQLSRVTKRVRTYTVGAYGVDHPGAYGQDRIPYLAKDYGLKVTLGVWLGNNAEWSEAELAKAIQVINDNPTVVDRVIVGNEAVGVRGELSADQVADYIKRLKRAITNKRIEVGYTDVWGAWMRNGMGKIADASDFVGIHLLPYWEGVSLGKSMDYITTSYGYIQKKFPGKKIVIGETGWPSEGRVKKGAVPSPAMEAAFLRNFLTLATAKNYDYYIMEGFDQPWKAGQEGAVGAFWGMYDAQGTAKFNFVGALSSFDQWPKYAAIASALTFAIGLAVLMAMPAVSFAGYVMMGSIIGLVVTGGLFIVDASSLRYVDWSTLGGALFVVPASIFTALLLITETTEWALSLWRQRRVSLPRAEMRTWPKVSIHLPTHNEPPEMVIQTINALARLDYPSFEVIVLDNNTADEALWKPVQAHCMGLGHKFRFFHFENMKGFKAGALNKALDLTAADAEHIAVIDSDYQVSPEWLKTVVPAFVDEKVAVVQAPQDYRDAGESLFKTLCYEEYTSFFRVGMVERNEHNAIIQHGTMCVVRRAALEEVGRWAEWCITEDTELGLRLFEAGYTAHYTPVSMGRGLMPDSYEAYKGQRYRWVYGAMQIMKRHAKQIFAGKSKLTLAQRYHFVAGWLPWLADAFALLFGVLALVWTALVAVAPKHFDVPLTALSGVALTLFAVKTIKTIHLHRAKVSSGIMGAVGAAITGLALSYTVGKGVILGLLTSSCPFLRTPKCEDTAPWTHALRIAKFETFMLMGTLTAIFSTVAMGKIDDPAQIAWLAALIVLAVPYAAALLVALGSTVKLGRRTLELPLPVAQPELQPIYARSEVDAA